MHTPVLLNEVITSLLPQKGKTYIDATFGGGGYSRKILETTLCSVVALDRDPEAEKRAQFFLKSYAHRFHFIRSNFGNLETSLNAINFSGIVFDFGLSSFQLNDGSRGFSFQIDGPLDMRMEKKGLTAEEIVNTFSQKELAQIIKVYGEEHFAERISYALVEKRKNSPLKTTFELANLVRSVVPKYGAIDPATKTFQALRIFINDELHEIQKALNAIIVLLVKKKIEKVSVVTVAFHALEDRIVKNWIKGYGMDSSLYSKIIWDYEHSHVIVPTREELKMNSRSRSARLRAVTLSLKQEL